MPRLDPKQPENWSLIRPILEQILEVGEVESIRHPIIDEFLGRVALKQQLETQGILPKRFAMLGTPQKATLMACFAGQLILWNRAQQDTEIQIAALSREEMAILEQGYDQQTLAGTFWGKYRNLIRWLIQENWLQLSEINSFDLERLDNKTNPNESEKQIVSAEYYTDAYLKYDLAFYQDMKSATSQRNQEKISNPRPVALLPLLREYQRLLQSNDLYELAIALSGVTGRRFSEVIAKGQFESAGEYKLAFSGQLKTKESSSFEIPTLFPSEQILKAIARFRQIPEIAAVKEETIKVLNNKFNPTINNRIYQLFQEKGLIAPLEGETKVTIHNLRALYGEIATHFFCPTRNQFPQFLDQNLGHVKSAGNLSNALSHYFRYQLVDETFKPIDTLGVKLSALGDRYLPQIRRLLNAVQPHGQITALVASTGLYPHELLGIGQLAQASPQYFTYRPPLQRPQDLDRKVPLLADSVRLWEIRQSLIKTLPELKESLTGRQLDEILESKAQPVLEQLGLPSFHVLRLYHLDYTLEAIADPKAKKPEKVTQLRIYAQHKALLERYKGDRTQAEIFGELIETYIQTRERNTPTKIETLQQEISELKERLEKITSLETQIINLKLENSHINQQNTQLLTEKQAINQENERLTSQIDSLTRSNRELSAPVSVAKVQPIDPTPLSTSVTTTDTAPPSPISNDFSKVLEGLQTLSTALQQWQGQNAPSISTLANSPSTVPPQSEPPTTPLETSPVPIAAIAQPAGQSPPKPSDRSPIAYNFLEQQISQIIDRLMSFNDQSQSQVEKWYISLNLFRDADLTHSLKSLRKVFTHRKPELDAHHQRHSLNHRQNTRHNAQNFKKQFADDWLNLY
jgi:integrase